MLTYKKPADQADGLRRMVQQRPVRVITVTSGKGGVGKTTVCVNLAMAMRRAGKDVMIMDADLGLANVDLMLGMHPQYNLTHVVSGERSLDEIIAQGPEGIMVVPAASGAQMMVDLTPTQHAAIIRAFSELRQNVDVLLVDTAAGISGSVVSFSKASQEVVVVVSDEPASITDAYALIKLLNRDHGLHRFRILANMVPSDSAGKQLFEKITRVTDRYLYVELDYMGHIPMDPMLRKAIQQQRPVVEVYPESAAALGFGDLAARMERWPVPRSGGHLEFFMERLIQQGHMEASAYL